MRQCLSTTSNTRLGRIIAEKVDVINIDINSIGNRCVAQGCCIIYYLQPAPVALWDTSARPQPVLVGTTPSRELTQEAY